MYSIPRPTILFDIDGTLLRTRGAGRSAIDIALQDMFGIVNTTKVPLAGRTDYAILSDIFQANGIDFSEHYESFSTHYHKQLELTLQEIEGDVLPGVKELLEQLKEVEFPLGIITGNGRTPAWAKLKRFGLESYFNFGGYGDSSPNRNDVAAQAIEAASQALKNDFQIHHCWVVGDTPADVECAKSVGAKSIAVLTGGFDHNDFVDYSADEIVNDLTHISLNFFG